MRMPADNVVDMTENLPPAGGASAPKEGGGVKKRKPSPPLAARPRPKRGAG